jgi:hypothetical protein
MSYWDILETSVANAPINRNATQQRAVLGFWQGGLIASHHATVPFRGQTRVMTNFTDVVFPNMKVPVGEA